MNEANLSPTTDWADRITVEGAVSVEPTPAGLQPWRIPYQQRPFFEPGLAGRASTPAGVRLRFRSTTRTVTFEVEQATIDPPERGTFDLYVDGTFHGRVRSELADRAITFNLGAGSLPERSSNQAIERGFELYFPQFTVVRLRGLRVDPGATLAPWPDPGPRWVTYGSSITHCRAADGPSETWPAIVARRFGLNLTCLGFGGECHLDPLVGRVIRDRPADLITLCLGINVVVSASLSERMFRSAAIGLIQTIRDGHPHTPIGVISPIHAPARESTPNAVGMTLEKTRPILEEMVAAFRAAGDPAITYIHGLDLFGPEWISHLPDQVHPDAQGYRHLADQFAKVVMPRVGYPSDSVPRRIID